MQTKIFRIYGPPGTGKTTALLNKVDEALGQGIPPSKIGYFAFTRQAAYEASERACQRFGLEEGQLPWFRTLHSFALRLSGIKAEQVMQTEHYRELSEAIGIKLMPDNTNGDDNIFESNACRPLSQHYKPCTVEKDPFTQAIQPIKQQHRLVKPVLRRTVHAELQEQAPRV